MMATNFRIRNVVPVMFTLLFQSFFIHKSVAQENILGNDPPLIKVEKWIKGTPFNQFQKGKVYVVEFGATWCVPCKALIPQLSLLSEHYGKEIQVLSVFVMENYSGLNSSNSVSYITRVENFVREHNAEMNYSIAIDGPKGYMEKNWLKANNIEGVPAIFVIDRDSKIVWKGVDPNELNKVVSFVTSKNYNIKDFQKFLGQRSQEGKFDYDHTQLLLQNGNGGADKDFAFRSVLVRSSGRLIGPQYDWVSNFEWVRGTEIAQTTLHNAGRIQLINRSIAELYFIAYADTFANNVSFRNIHWEYPDTTKSPHLRDSYGRTWFEPLLQVSDNRPFKVSPNSSENRYHYSLKINVDSFPSAKWMQRIMQNDLDSYFGFTVLVENRLMPCWKLVIVDSTRVGERLLSKVQGQKLDVRDDQSPFLFRNAITRDIINYLGSTFGYKRLDRGKLKPEDQAPFIDCTGISAQIDFICDRGWSFKEATDYFRDLGLDVIKSKQEMKVIVIRDPISM